jgi:hypothetical protein
MDISQVGSKNKYGVSPSSNSSNKDVKKQVFSSKVDKVEIKGAMAQQLHDANLIENLKKASPVKVKSLDIDQINRALQTSIGQKVEALFEKAGIEMSSIAGADWSAEATSDRLFKMNASLFEVWKSQNKNMSEIEQVDSFEKVIRKSMDQGASEAISLLSFKGFAEDDITMTSRLTMKLVHERFDVFFDNLRESISD